MLHPVLFSLPAVIRVQNINHFLLTSLRTPVTVSIHSTWTQPTATDHRTLGTVLHHCFAALPQIPRARPTRTGTPPLRTVQQGARGPAAGGGVCCAVAPCAWTPQSLSRSQLANRPAAHPPRGRRAAAVCAESACVSRAGLRRASLSPWHVAPRDGRHLEHPIAGRRTAHS